MCYADNCFPLSYLASLFYIGIDIGNVSRAKSYWPMTAGPHWDWILDLVGTGLPGITGLGLLDLVGTGLPGLTGPGLLELVRTEFLILVRRKFFIECGCLLALCCTPHLSSPPWYHPLLLQTSLRSQVSQETTSCALLSGPSAKEDEGTRLAACFI